MVAHKTSWWVGHLEPPEIDPTRSTTKRRSTLPPAFIIIRREMDASETRPCHIFYSQDFYWDVPRCWYSFPPPYFSLYEMLLPISIQGIVKNNSRSKIPGFLKHPFSRLCHLTANCSLQLPGQKSLDPTLRVFTFPALKF